MNPCKNPEVLAREEEGARHLMFNRTTQHSLILNHTSYYIWHSCDGTRDTEGIVQSIKERYDLSASDLTTEQLSELVEEHLSLLQRTNLLVESPAIAA